MKITLAQKAKDEGYSDTMSFVVERGDDSVVPACCDEGCEVEPDGTCEHGGESILLAAGMI